MLSRLRPGTSTELRRTGYDKTLKLRLNVKNSRSRRAFEVATGKAVIREITKSQQEKEGHGNRNLVAA